MQIQCEVGTVKCNVISVARLCDKGCEVVFSSSGGSVTRGGKSIELNRRGGLFFMKLAKARPARQPAELPAALAAPVELDEMYVPLDQHYEEVSQRVEAQRGLEVLQCEEQALRRTTPATTSWCSGS